MSQAKFTVFDPVTGESKGIGLCQKHMVERQVRPGHVAIEGHFPAAEFVIEDKGERPGKARFVPRRKTAKERKVHVDKVRAHGREPLVDPATKLARFLQRNPDVRDLIDKAAAEGVETTKPE